MGGGVGPCKLLSGWCKQSPGYFSPLLESLCVGEFLETHSLSLHG